jgi:hypothetical protein
MSLVMRDFSLAQPIFALLALLRHQFFIVAHQRSAGLCGRRRA